MLGGDEEGIVSGEESSYSCGLMPKNVSELKIVNNETDSNIGNDAEDTAQNEQKALSTAAAKSKLAISSNANTRYMTSSKKRKRPVMAPMFERYANDAEKSEIKFSTQHIQELYYIAHIKNLQSILDKGILSHKRAGKLSVPYTDISNGVVQALRSEKILERCNKKKKPLSIHRHAVLYLNPHNAMMFKKKDESICIIRVNKEIINRGDAVISNKNASVSNAEFFTTEAYQLVQEVADKLASNLSTLNTAEKNVQNEYKQVRQSEALLPYEISPIYFTGVIVKNKADMEQVNKILVDTKKMPVEIVPSAFFQVPFPHPLEQFPLKEKTIEKHAYPDTSGDESEAKSSTPPTIITLRRTSGHESEAKSSARSTITLGR